MTNEVTMIDADMARFIRFDKGDFVGRQATLDQQDRLRHSGECRNPVDKEATLQLVYFEVDAIDSDIRGSEPMFKGDECVGVTTSGGYGHYVQKSLGFGYVTPELAKPGTELSIDLLGERCPARVLKEPAYDPANERLKL